MIAYLQGSLISIRKDYIIVKTIAGVGYKLFYNNKEIQLSTGKETEFFVFENIREDADDLYGFDTVDELELFQKLISVNGVGPKSAMAIMANGNCGTIFEAISCENVAFFQSVSGIGKKAAAKIILELKSKLSDASAVISDHHSHSDVGEGLVLLGYKKEEIFKVLARIPMELNSSEDKIKWCLRNISK